MQIGIPREIKPLEGRVALSPEACGDLVHGILESVFPGFASRFAENGYVGKS